jgi:L-seryl-tRNA(Ser) seleniumtransferase
MRPDKATLAAVAATLGLYRAGVATREIPVWRQIATSVDVLRRRATLLAERVGPAAAVTETLATVGGGSLPGETLRSVAIALEARSADALLRRLRIGDPAVVGRIEDGCVLLDLRTVDPEQDDDLATAVAAAVAAR